MNHSDRDFLLGSPKHLWGDEWEQGEVSNPNVVQRYHQGVKNIGLQKGNSFYLKKN